MLESAAMCERTADQLERAVRHCHTTVGHFRSKEMPRGTAHAWAAYGHILEVADRISQLL